MAIINLFEDRARSNRIGTSWPNVSRQWSEADNLPSSWWGYCPPRPMRALRQPEPCYARDLRRPANNGINTAAEREPISRGRYLELWRDDEDDHGRPYNRRTDSKRSHKARKQWARHVRRLERNIQDQSWELFYADAVASGDIFTGKANQPRRLTPEEFRRNFERRAA